MRQKKYPLLRHCLPLEKWESEQRKEEEEVRHTLCEAVGELQWGRWRGQPQVTGAWNWHLYGWSGTGRGEALTRTEGVFTGFFTYQVAQIVPRVPRTARLSRVKLGRPTVLAASAKKETQRGICLAQ